jgi:hypothetical protein
MTFMQHWDKSVELIYPKMKKNGDHRAKAKMPAACGFDMRNQCGK